MISARFRFKFWISLFLLFGLLFLSGDGAESKSSDNVLYSPVGITIKLTKSVVEVGKPVTGTIILLNTYPTTLKAVFNVQLFHEKKLVSEWLMSISQVFPGKTEFSFKEFSIPPFNDGPAAVGRWRIRILQQSLPPSAAREAVIRIVPPRAP